MRSRPQSWRHLALFTCLYASEGAPIGFIWWALPTVLRSADVPVEAITGLTSMLVLPWAFKFLWAPLVDRLRSARWHYRGWIAAAQVTMALALLPLILLDPVSQFDAWRWLLLVHAVSAATQDVAIDAFAIASVPADSRGRLNGAMQAGMLLGRSLFGGGALLVLALWGHAWIVGALVGWILAALTLLLLARDVHGAVDDAEGRSGAPASSFRRDLSVVLRRASTWWGIAFALVSAAAFEATGQLAGPYLIDAGVSSERVGVFFGVFVVGATLTGGLAGGALSDRWGRARSCAVFLLVFVVAIVALAAADRGGALIEIRLALLTAMYFGVGLFTAASYALFMDLTDPRLGGTQFSTFMSATNACESWSAWAGGRIAGTAGYPSAFLAMSVASLFGLPLLWMLRATRTARRTDAPT
jgi:MFS family permease